MTQENEMNGAAEAPTPTPEQQALLDQARAAIDAQEDPEGRPKPLYETAFVVFKDDDGWHANNNVAADFDMMKVADLGDILTGLLMAAEGIRLEQVVTNVVQNTMSNFARMQQEAMRQIAEKQSLAKRLAVPGAPGFPG